MVPRFKSIQESKIYILLLHIRRLKQASYCSDPTMLAGAIMRLLYSDPTFMYIPHIVVYENYSNFLVSRILNLTNTDLLGLE